MYNQNDFSITKWTKRI